MKYLCILGATGSIGTQVLDLVRLHPNLYRVIAFSFGKNDELAKRIIAQFKPEYVACGESTDLGLLRDEFPNVLFENGTTALNKVATYPCPNPVVINALVGSVGCMPTAAALKEGRNVLLANKETLVMAGEIIMKLARENGAQIIPIDSEHSAIAQMLVGKDPSEIRRLIITASGGSLYNKTRKELSTVTKEEALNHPNWKMGPKITIDSATMMNKGFEIIEASYLFNIPLSKIDVVIHRESIVHSFVEFVDGSVMAQMATPDMHLPILFALNYPKHTTNGQYTPLDLITMAPLSFKQMDEFRFPCIKYAKWTMKKGGFYPACLNAINETMVELFLNGIVTIEEIDIEIGNMLYDMTLPVVWENLDFTIENVMKIDQIVKNKIKRKFMR